MKKISRRFFRNDSKKMPLDELIGPARRDRVYHVRNIHRSGDIVYPRAEYDIAEQPLQSYPQKWYFNTRTRRWYYATHPHTHYPRIDTAFDCKSPPYEQPSW